MRGLACGKKGHRILTIRRERAGRVGGGNVGYGSWFLAGCMLIRGMSYQHGMVSQTTESRHGVQE